MKSNIYNQSPFVSGMSSHQHQPVAEETPRRGELQELDSSQFRVHSTKNDGDCFFRCLGMALEPDFVDKIRDNRVMELRHELADYVREYSDYLSTNLPAFQLAGVNNLQNLLETQGQWAGDSGDLVPIIAAQVTGHEIHILRPSDNNHYQELQVIPAYNHELPGPNQSPANGDIPSIFLLKHDWCHYELLTEKEFQDEEMEFQDAPSDSHHLTINDLPHNSLRRIQSLEDFDKNRSSANQLKRQTSLPNQKDLSLQESSESFIHRGDVLLLKDVRSAVTVAVAAAQSVFSHSISYSGSSRITHAGLASGRDEILEASNQGLRNATLESKPPGATYEVYRHQDKRTAETAALWAENLVLTRALDPRSTSKSKGFGNYSLKGTGGILRSSSRGEKAMSNVSELLQNPWRDRGFYCSNFVAASYELASKGESPINVDFKQISPKRLHGELKNDPKWSYEGRYVVEDNDSESKNTQL